MIWNWDEVLADSLNRVAESDDKTKRDMFPVLLEQGKGRTSNSKVFKNIFLPLEIERPTFWSTYTRKVSLKVSLAHYKL